MKSRMIGRRKQATILVSRETLEMAIREGNSIAEKLMQTDPNSPQLDQLEEAIGRLSIVLTKSQSEMQQEGASGLEDYLDNAKMPEAAAAIKKDVDLIAQTRQGTRPERIIDEVPMAEQPVQAAGNGSDAFVTDRDDKGQPKTPETAVVPRVAAKKAAPAAAAPVAPAPVPAAPATGVVSDASVLEVLPTEFILKMVEDIPKQEGFQQNKQLQDALIRITEILKARPVMPAEPEVAAGAPKAAAKGEPFGGKQAPPFGSEKKEEKKTGTYDAEGDKALSESGMTEEEKKTNEEYNKSLDNPDDKQAAKTAVAPPGWEGTVKEMKKEQDIDNPWALAWSMKDKGYTPHAAKWLLKRKGASYVAKKFGSGNAGGAWTSDQATSKVEEGSKVPEIAQAHGLRDDNTGIARPETTLPEKLASEMTTSKALKAAQDAQEKLKALYLTCKPLTEANNTRAVRAAVELVYAAYSAFDEAVKTFNKQLMQEEQEAEAQAISEKKKKSSFGGLALVASAE